MGIEQTTDLARIKSAYRERLNSVNPEDDPEGFMLLRGAYEDAVKWVKSGGEEAVKDAPEAELTGASALVDALYRDYERRIDAECWRELFDDDLFVALDSSQDSRDALLVYLMTHIFIPRACWQVIAEQTELEEQRKDYAEHLPEDYIDFILFNAKNDDMIPFELVNPGLDEIDAFISLYKEIDMNIRKFESAGVREKIEKLKMLDPDFRPADFLLLRFRLQRLIKKKEDGDDISVELSRLVKDFDELEESLDLVDVSLLCGYAHKVAEEYDRAEELYNKVLEKSPEHQAAQGELCDCAFLKGDYEKARDGYIEILKKNQYDSNARAGMIRADQELVNIYRKKIEQDPSDVRMKFEFAWSCYQCFEFEEAVKMLDTFTPSYEDSYEYYNVKGRCYLCLKRYEEARNCFLVWRSRIDEIPEDTEDEELQKKRSRLGYVIFLLGDAAMRLKEYDAAMEYFDRAKKIPHEEQVITYESYCELLYLMGKYERCLDACDELQTKDVESFVAYIYRAKSSIKLSRGVDAIRACEKAISIFPYSGEPYTLLIRIYLDAKRTDNAEDIVKLFYRYGGESANVMYHEALIKEAKGETDAAIELLNKVAAEFSEGPSDLEDFSKVYAMLGNLYIGKNDLDKAEEALFKAVEIKPGDELTRKRLLLLADACFMAGKSDNAIELLKRGIEAYKDYKGRDFIHKLIRIAGCEGYMNLCSEAFSEGIDRDPADVHIYSEMGGALRDNGLLREARKVFEKGISLDTKHRENLYCELVEVMLLKKSFIKPNVSALTEKALELEKCVDSPYIVVKLMRLYRALGRYKDALETAKKGMNMKFCIGCSYQGCHEIMYQMGLTFEAQGRYLDALTCFKKALSVALHNPLYDKAISRVEAKIK
ncbi:MAG: tetratricopeptide repeat protein [Lachnospiraceae bacterium]|nr:tetratricopeptide repeat protein [Lachnospiraceae bacterium]